MTNIIPLAIPPKVTEHKYKGQTILTKFHPSTRRWTWTITQVIEHTLEGDSSGKTEKLTLSYAKKYIDKYIATEDDVE